MRLLSRPGRVAAQVELHQILAWYVRGNQSTWEGRGTLPFYCDPTRVGAFAVTRDELAAGRDGALFRLFITMSMFQALRDVVIMRHQRALAPSSVRALTDLDFLQKSIARHGCSALLSHQAFETGCDVTKAGGAVDCHRCPSIACHVKDATVAFNRMGDMGKLPTSAWLQHWKNGGVRRVLDEVLREEIAPTMRAALLVERFGRVHRVGRKLATMFVSALSTPALAPGHTPWFPEVDGNDLVVVDTNVARAVDTLRPANATRTYEARVQWLRGQAATLDLRKFHRALPRYSPRLVQQALYAFCSRSNRAAGGDRCASESHACEECVPKVCPFPTGTR